MQAERVIAHREKELMHQIHDPIDDGSSGKQEGRPSNQPGCQVLVPEGVGIPKVMALVDEYEAPGSRGEPATADLFMGAQSDGDGEPIGRGLPLGEQGCGYQTCRGSAVHSRGNRERHVGLAASHGVGQQRSLKPANGSQHPSEAPRLWGEEPDWGARRMFRWTQAPSQGPRYRQPGGGETRVESREKHIRHSNQRLSDDRWGGRPGLRAGHVGRRKKGQGVSPPLYRSRPGLLLPSEPAEPVR
jgi:hypothetical protein